jgi:hypothetical protein
MSDISMETSFNEHTIEEEFAANDEMVFPVRTPLISRRC